MPGSINGQPTQLRPAQLRRVLGLPALVFFGLVYMVPLTIFTTYGIVTELTGGRTAGAYIVTLVAMLFTAASYSFMVKRFPVAGSAYSYTNMASARTWVSWRAGRCCSTTCSCR